MSAAPLQWSYNPWRERPGRSWAALAWLLLGFLLLAVLGLPWGVRLGLSLAFAASFASALVPESYRLDEAGVTLGRGPFARHRPWPEVRRAVRSREGVLLSPLATRGWLDAYRAVFLALPRHHAPLADDVKRVLAEHGL